MSDDREAGTRALDDVEDEANPEGGDSARPPVADPTYDLPGDNPLAAEDDDD